MGVFYSYINETTGFEAKHHHKVETQNPEKLIEPQHSSNSHGRSSQFVLLSFAWKWGQIGLIKFYPWYLFITVDNYKWYKIVTDKQGTSNEYRKHMKLIRSLKDLWLQVRLCSFIDE